MKALLIMLLITPLVQAEVFLEFPRHEHANGTIHYTNVPNNRGANFISIVNSDLSALEEKNRRVREYQQAKKIRHELEAQTFKLSGTVATVGHDYIVLRKVESKEKNPPILDLVIVKTNGSSVAYYDDVPFYGKVRRTTTSQYVSKGGVRTLPTYILVEAFDYVKTEPTRLSREQLEDFRECRDELGETDALSSREITKICNERI